MPSAISRDISPINGERYMLFETPDGAHIAYSQDYERGVRTNDVLVEDECGVMRRAKIVGGSTGGGCGGDTISTEFGKLLKGGAHTMWNGEYLTSINRQPGAVIADGEVLSFTPRTVGSPRVSSAEPPQVS